MTDVLTHFVSARLLWFVWGRPSVRILFYSGVCLPDILQKFLVNLTQTPYNFTAPTHSVAGLIIYCYIISFIFEERFRHYAFIALYSGSLLHLFVDLFKSGVGVGMQFLTPFSMRGFELGLYVNEEILFILPIDILIILLLELCTRRLQKDVF